MNPALRDSAAHVFVADLDLVDVSDGDLHHLGRVLRLRDGEPVSVSDGRGGWRTARWSGGGLVVDGPIHHDRRVARLSIAAAMPKGDRLEWMVEKLTELGVDEIILLECERGVVRWDADKAERVMSRWERLVRSSAAQSRRVWLPVVRGPIAAGQFLAGSPTAALCEPGGPALGSLEPLPSCIVIGPEGGFSAAELGGGHPRLSLGPTILRVETAALAAAAQWTALCPVDHGA